MNQTLGKYIIILGLIIITAGIILYFFHDSFKWFGRLPGDINVKRRNFQLHFPVATMLIVSVVLTLIINFVRKFI